MSAEIQTRRIARRISGVHVLALLGLVCFLSSCVCTVSEVQIYDSSGSPCVGIPVTFKGSEFVELTSLQDQGVTTNIVGHEYVVATDSNGLAKICYDIAKRQPSLISMILFHAHVVGKQTVEADYATADGNRVQSRTEIKVP